MADIDIQQKRRSVWPVIIGLLIALLLLWGLYEAFDTDEPEVAAVVVPAVPADTTASMPAAAPVPAPVAVPVAVIPVAAILASPANYGAPLDGSARVTEVPTDRGFWIEDEGRRMFAVIDEPTPETKNINPGQTVQLTQARVYPSTRVDEIPGELDADTRRIIQTVPAVLYVMARNITIMSDSTSAAAP